MSWVPPAGWLGPRDDGAVHEGCGGAYLLLVTLLALALRLIRLDGMALWIDEVFTWGLIAPDRGFSFTEQILAAYQGPLYHAAAWPLLRWQDSEFMLRLPSALASAAAVPLLGIATARLAGRQAGRLAAVLLALSPFAVWYGQEARGYGLLIFFATASGLVLVDALQRGLTVPRALLLALLIFGGLGSNFAYVFLLVAFGLTVLAWARPRTPGDWARWSLALGGGVVLALPWLLEALGIWEVGRVVPGAATGEALRGETTFSIWALPFSGWSLLYGFSLGPSLRELHFDRFAAIREHAPVIALGALVAVATIVLALRRLDRPRWVLLLWILVPLAGVVLLALRNVKPFNVRYVAAAAPWLLALLAIGLATAGRRLRWLLGGALCLLFAAALVNLYADDRYAKADVRGAVVAIAEAGGPERPLLVPTVGPVVRYYRQRQNTGGGPILGLWDEAQVRDAAMADALVARQLAEVDEAWVLWARAWFLDPQGHLPGALDRVGSLERVHEGPGVAVDLWRREPAPPTERAP
jgi:4-amino-4-deoxy-L-arabinose transferase-like glycosyltransferase